MNKFGEIDSPISPNMSPVSFHIGIFVSLAIQFLSQSGVVLVEEIGITYANPEELWLGSKEVSQLIIHIVVDILVGTTAPLLLADGCGEQTYITKGLRLLMEI